MTPMSTEAEMGGMQAMGQGAWSRGGWRGGKELSLGLWEELVTPTPDVGRSE